MAGPLWNFAKLQPQTMSASHAHAVKLTAAGAALAAAAKLTRINATKVRVAECRSFAASYTLAQEIDPSCVLDYIPMRDRTSCHWDVGRTCWGRKEYTLVHPNKGRLEWVGEDAPPVGYEGMMKTKLFVCRGFVAGM